MINKNLFICLLLVFSNASLLNLCLCEDTFGEILNQMPSGHNQLAKTAGDSGGRAVSISIPSRGVSIIRYVKNSDHFYINGGVNIRLELFNTNPDEKVSQISVQEELPDGLKIENSSEKYTYITSNKIEWDLDDLTSTRIIDYTLNPTKKHNFILNPTISRAKITDENGRPYNIVAYSDPTNLNLYNRHPVITKVHFSNGSINKGDNAIISASFYDPDNDPINCVLWSSLDGYINASPTSSLNSRDYTWSLTNCSSGLQKFTIIVSDGEFIEQKEAELQVIDWVGIRPFLMIPKEYGWVVFLVAVFTALFTVVLDLLFNRVFIPWLCAKCIRRLNFDPPV